MQTRNIVEALLDIEQKAEATLTGLAKDMDKLPARIAAETGHVRKQILQEAEAAAGSLKVEIQKESDARISAIQEEGKQVDFAQDIEIMRRELFKRITTWTTMP